jgi:hypothetical protein
VLPDDDEGEIRMLWLGIPVVTGDEEEGR